MKRKIQILTMCLGVLSILSINLVHSQTELDCPEGCACSGNKEEFQLHYDSEIYDCKVQGCNCWGSVN